MVVGTLHCSILVGTLKPRQGVRQGVRQVPTNILGFKVPTTMWQHDSPRLTPCLSFSVPTKMLRFKVPTTMRENGVRGGETRSETGGETGSKIGSETGGETGSMTGGKSGSKTGSETGAKWGKTNLC